MTTDELASEIDYLFNPEIDEDLSPRELPHERLEQYHKLNFDHLKQFNWEGSTIHPSTRICPEDDTGLASLIKNDDVPRRLFEAALRVYGDSLVRYMDTEKTVTELRFYPPVILTFWSAFEAFVRHCSEMMILTSKEIPGAASDFLREVSPKIDRKGAIGVRTQFTSVLDRYSVLLHYGFNLDVDRGNRHWQNLEEAKELRDYYTHIDVTRSRSISDQQVLAFLEAVLLGIIWPSSLVQRSLMIGAINIYWVWASLRELTAEHLPPGHVEEPAFHSWNLERQPFMFYCPFTSADTDRFPNSDQDRRRRPKN